MRRTWPMQIFACGGRCSHYMELFALHIFTYLGAASATPLTQGPRKGLEDSKRTAPHTCGNPGQRDVPKRARGPTTTAHHPAHTRTSPGPQQAMRELAAQASNRHWQPYLNRTHSIPVSNTVEVLLDPEVPQIITNSSSALA